MGNPKLSLAKITSRCKTIPTPEFGGRIERGFGY